MPATKKQDVQTWHPSSWDPADAGAMQALQRGNASPDQQKRALDWIIRSAGTYDLSYRPASPRDTDFSEGKRFMGLQIVKLLNVNLNVLLKKESEHG